MEGFAQNNKESQKSDTLEGADAVQYLIDSGEIK